MENVEKNIKIEDHYGIGVLRDDLLVGGTKSILLDSIFEAAINVNDSNNAINEFVYVSPVYGGFQIALSAYCKKHNKKATIFCAKRNKRHPNTELCASYSANIVEVPYGYLTVVEKRAREYINQQHNHNQYQCQQCQLGEHPETYNTKTQQTTQQTRIHKIAFGAKSPENIDLIACRAKSVIESFTAMFKNPPDEIWCAVGSGTLLCGIIQAVNELSSQGQGMVGGQTKIYGVQVGAEFKGAEACLAPLVTIIKYPKPFEYASKLKIDFPSMSNYDLKAFEMCLRYNGMNPMNKKILFWNVL